MKKITKYLVIKGVFTPMEVIEKNGYLVDVDTLSPLSTETTRKLHDAPKQIPTWTLIKKFRATALSREIEEYEITSFTSSGKYRVKLIGSTDKGSLYTYQEVAQMMDNAKANILEWKEEIKRFNTFADIQTHSYKITHLMRKLDSKNCTTNQLEITLEALKIASDTLQSMPSH